MTDRDYFTADTHFNHGRIMKYSGRTEFMTPEDRAAYEAIKDNKGGPYLAWTPSEQSRKQMDEGLIERINAVVPPDATLWHLGDFAFVNKPGEVKKYLNAINCKDVRLIWGNHDRRKAYLPGFFSAYYESTMIYVFPDRTLTEAEIQADHDLKKMLHKAMSQKKVQPIQLSHYAHAIWNGSHKGWFHLYGHSHGGLRPWIEQHMPNALSMDVGVDCTHYAPLSFSEIFRILGSKRAAKPAHVLDHHGVKLKVESDLNPPE